MKELELTKKETKSEKRNLDGIISKHENFKDLCPICKTNYKNLSSKKCKKCAILEQRQKAINDLSNKLPKEVLKDYLKNKSKNKVLEDFKIHKSQLKKLCEYYSLPYYESDIKSYSDEEWNKL